ncbi:MAG: DUF922 domain-containing protein [Arenimonas sp.]|nr:DUF922 domain-containing protein [Arenimonas sp.]
MASVAARPGAWTAGALLLAAAAAAEPGPAAAPGPKITESRHYYRVDATGLESLRAQLFENATAAGLAPGTIGRTRQAVEVRYLLDPLPDRCRLSALAIHLDLAIDLPEWQPSGTTRPELRARWAQMISALTRHEEGHRDNAIWAAKELHERLSQLGEGADCDALGKLAQREMFRVKLRFNLREQAYDRRTGHGVSQGTVL